MSTASFVPVLEGLEPARGVTPLPGDARMPDADVDETVLTVDAVDASLPAITPLGQIDELLREPSRLLERIQSGADLVSLARTMLLTIACCAIPFGATMGLYRGGVQVLFAAVKFPMVLLLTTLLCAPAFSALKAGVQQPGELRRDFALVLSSLALACLVLAALTPLTLLAVCLEVGYHDLILLIVACCAGSGLVGGALFARGLARQMTRSRITVAAALLCLMGLVSAQVSWTLRPFVVRPRTPEVPFGRALEDDFFSSVATSTASMLGIYHRLEAPLPGALPEPVRLEAPLPAAAEEGRR